MKMRSHSSLSDPDEAALIDELSRLVHQAVIAGLVGSDHDTEVAPLTVARARDATAPARMASAQPGSSVERARTRVAYERCLQTYRTVVRAQDAALTTDDVGAATAFFVAACLHALHGIDPTPDVLTCLERQLRATARRSSNWAQASVAERQYFFEQMAILGVFIGGTWQHAQRQGRAAIANVQRAARGYLWQLLGLNPEMLTLDADGLSLRSDEVQPVEVQPVEPQPAPALH
jgi:hypothetical protein